MAHKHWEERLETSEREIMGLKEMVLCLHKSMEKLTEEMKESGMIKCREESCALVESRSKIDRRDGYDFDSQRDHRIKVIIRN